MLVNCQREKETKLVTSEFLMNTKKSLLEKASQEADEGELVALLAELTQCPVLLYDQFLFYLTSSMPTGGNQSGLAAWTDAIVSKKCLRRQIVEKTVHGPFYINPSKQQGKLCGAWAVPIKSGRRILGYLFILQNDRTDLNLSLCQEWSTVFAMVLVGHCQLWELKERLSSDFLERLLMRQIKPEEALLSGARLGLNIHKQWVILCASPDSLTEDKNLSFAWLQRLPAVCKYLQGELNKQFPDIWVGHLYSEVVVLVPSEGGTGSRAGKIASLVQEMLYRFLKSMTFTICTGPVCSQIDDYSHAFSEVVRAIKVSRLLHGKGQVVASKSLGSYAVLYDVQQTTFAQTFVKEILGPLLAYDEKHNSELVYILRIYLEEGGNIRHLTKAMYIHENTLRYRLKRIEEITGRSLGNAKNRFDFQLALRMLLIGNVC